MRPFHLSFVIGSYGWLLLCFSGHIYAAENIALHMTCSCSAFLAEAHVVMCVYCTLFLYEMPGSIFDWTFK